MVINTKKDLEKIKLPDYMANELIASCEEIRCESRSENCMQWICVKDRRPIIGIPVWVVVDNRVRLSAYYRISTGEQCHWECAIDGTSAIRFSRVTHWMEIPQPPKDGE